MKRVTVTLPETIVEEIDRWEKNRSKFVLEASLRELELRRRERTQQENLHVFRRAAGQGSG